MSDTKNGLVRYDNSGRPEYLPATIQNSGMESMGQDDYKTPRIILLQGLSPQLQTYPELARANQFWHSVMNVNLGTEFTFVPVVAKKRVILFRPRWDQGGGILAFSKNGKDWDSGRNQTFTVRPNKDARHTVEWNTMDNVLQSRLTEFGSSDPENQRSAPAASMIYEYLCYLPDYPELSPCVLGLNKTAVPNGKAFNSSLMMKTRSGLPIYCLMVRAFVEQKHNDRNEHWTVTNFALEQGYAPKDVYAVTERLAKEYADFYVEPTQEEAQPVSDEIAY